MTILENTVRIEASAERVWAVLASLDVLEQYDPGVAKTEVLTEQVSGWGRRAAVI